MAYFRIITLIGLIVMLVPSCSANRCKQRVLNVSEFVADRYDCNVEKVYDSLLPNSCKEDSKDLPESATCNIIVSIAVVLANDLVIPKKWECKKSIVSEEMKFALQSICLMLKE